MKNTTIAVLMLLAAPVLSFANEPADTTPVVSEQLQAEVIGHKKPTTTPPQKTPTADSQLACGCKPPKSANPPAGNPPQQFASTKKPHKPEEDSTLAGCKKPKNKPVEDIVA